MSPSHVPPPPPPPPPPDSSSTLGSRPSHPAWSSLMSDITISEDEGGHHHNHQYGEHQQHQQPAQFHKPLVRNEGSAASLLDYSQSSDDLETHRLQRQNKPREKDSSAGLFGSGISHSSTSFRFREDLTSSSRVVRFTSSSDLGRNTSVGSSNQVDCDSPVQLGHDNSEHDKNSRRRRTGNHHHRGNRATVNRETFLATSNRWVTQLAYSFRTPPVPKTKKQPMDDVHSSNTVPRGSQINETKNRRSNHSENQDQYEAKTTTLRRNSEHTPLLPLPEEETLNNTFPKRQDRCDNAKKTHKKTLSSGHLKRHPYDYISMAVTFLKDYEAARPPTLSANVTCITPWQVGLYRLKYSSAYSFLIGSAALALFLSSALEGPSPDDSNLRMRSISGLNLYALMIFATDLWIRGQFRESWNGQCMRRPPKLAFKTMPTLPVRVETRTSQADLLMRPLFLFGLVLGLENLGWLLAQPDKSFIVLYSSIWKPIVLFYVSSQARHAMEALLRIARTVIRVLVIELILILSFAAVACRLFHGFGPFDHLSVAWLSLFKLATTVVNPSIWMPMYQQTHWSAVFFVLFIVVTVFYMHSLVLAVVFQTYIQAATEIHDRSMTDREDALQLSYTCLMKQRQYDLKKRQSHQQQPENERKRIPSQIGIPMYLVREVLENIRSHYNPMKINALVEIFETSDDNDLDYATFRTKIRQALNASIRTARIASPLSMSIELTAVVVAITNFFYVILLTSSFSGFDMYQLQIGSVITIAGVVELIMRTNPLHVQNFTPMTRFDTAFDGLAMVAATISCSGIAMYLFNQEGGLEYILLGRAMDMVRVMRFFQIFRDVVRRSSDLLPALIGPLTLVMTMLHVFVYGGMALWGGAIEVGKLGEAITPLYDLNNFNTYLEGLVTMFQVLVVNDWHAIAEVFEHASRCSSPKIVYPFFVIGNLVGVSILLNVITAFFVESFVSKLGVTDGNKERVARTPRQDFSIKVSNHSRGRRMTSSHRLAHNFADDEYSDAHDADSEGSSDSSERFEFDVLEREGYDRIIENISGQHQDHFARQVCNHLEVFESLAPGREKVGYLVVCQQSMSRYGSVRFESEAAGFIDKFELNGLVSEMHGEILVLSSKASFGSRSLIRVLAHPTDKSKQLEVSASILRRHPALSLFVSRVVKGAD